MKAALKSTSCPGYRALGASIAALLVLIGCATSRYTDLKTPNGDVRVVTEDLDDCRSDGPSKARSFRSESCARLLLDVLPVSPEAAAPLALKACRAALDHLVNVQPDQSVQLLDHYCRWYWMLESNRNMDKGEVARLNAELAPRFLALLRANTPSRHEHWGGFELLVRHPDLLAEVWRIQGIRDGCEWQADDPHAFGPDACMHASSLGIAVSDKARNATPPKPGTVTRVPDSELRESMSSCKRGDEIDCELAADQLAIRGQYSLAVEHWTASIRSCGQTRHACVFPVEPSLIKILPFDVLEQVASIAEKRGLNPTYPLFARSEALFNQLQTALLLKASCEAWYSADLAASIRHVAMSQDACEMARKLGINISLDEQKRNLADFREGIERRERRLTAAAEREARDSARFWNALAQVASSTATSRSQARAQVEAARQGIILPPPSTGDPISDSAAQTLQNLQALNQRIAEQQQSRLAQQRSAATGGSRSSDTTWVKKKCSARWNKWAALCCSGAESEGKCVSDNYPSGAACESVPSQTPAGTSPAC